MPEPKFLVVRLSSLGDIVHTFPAVAALRETYPNAEIVWLTHPRWKLLVESSGLATEVWAADTRSLSPLRQILSRSRERRFTLAIDYQGLWKSAAIPYFGGVPRRIGISSETVREYGVPILYTDRVRCSHPHIADQNGELSLRAGSRRGCAGFALAVSRSDAEAMGILLESHGLARYVVLSSGGGWRSKCWPPEHFGVLSKKIREALGLRCIVNYGPGEELLAASVRKSSGSADPLLYNGDLGRLMALLGNADCIVGGDTGPLHLAVALGTPAVALFGPTDPARNGPYRVDDSGGVPCRDIVLRSPRAVTSYKRGDQTDPSMLELEVDAVFLAVRRLVEARV